MGRNCNSNRMKIRKIKTVCLTWLLNFKPKLRHTSSKSKKQKKLLPSIWPNSVKPNRNSRKLKKDPKWLKLKFLHFLPFKIKKVENDNLYTLFIVSFQISLIVET